MRLVFGVITLTLFVWGFSRLNLSEDSWWPAVALIVGALALGIAAGIL